MLATLVLVAAALTAVGCSALVGSEVAEPACEVWPGDPNPCPAGYLCFGDPDGDNIVHGMCRPGRSEICDGLDNDGNGIIDDNPTFDSDGDGYTWCGSGNPARIDCNDGNPAVHPYNSDTMLPVEVCDGIDNDCNGIVDDPMRACPGETPFCSTARRCYQSGDCSVPEGNCSTTQFCDTQMAPPRCTTTPPTGCISNPASCGALRCNTATNMCETRLALGAACGKDDDCASGACFDAPALSYSGSGSGRVCSAPCCSDADCAAAGGHCLVTALGGRGCVPSIGTDSPGACSDDHDCPGQVCHAFPNVQTGGAPHLRTVCASGSVVSGGRCSTNLCPFGICFECSSGTCLSNGCATSCSTGADCYSGICSSGLCRSACRTSADCPTEMRCGLLSRSGDRIQGCVFRQSLAATGAPCTSATDCVDNYCSPEGVCSPVCCTDASCGAGVCRPVNNGGWEMRCVGAGSAPH